MPQTTTERSLSSRVHGTFPARWKEFKFIQDDNFKELSPDARQKLKASILANEFTQPFYVWKDPQTEEIYCLDGKHRTLILEELIGEGYVIPDELPATFINCNNRREAAKLVLTYSSMYAKITEVGFLDFLGKHELEFTSVLNDIDIPDIDLNKLFGDGDKDFSVLNQELHPETYENKMIMKLSFEKNEYLAIQKKLQQQPTPTTAEKLFLDTLFPNGMLAPQ